MMSFNQLLYTVYLNNKVCLHNRKGKQTEDLKTKKNACEA